MRNISVMVLVLASIGTVKSDLHLRLREANRESHMGFCVATQP
jgi:hypothetical protein